MTAREYATHDHWAFAKGVPLGAHEELVRVAALSRAKPFTSRDIAELLGMNVIKVAFALGKMRWPRNFTMGINVSVWTPAPKA